MKIYLFVAVFVFTCVPELGQVHVVVSPASLTPLSASTVASANAALAAASGSSAFDVRIAYMTSAGGIEGDRYQEYLDFKEPTDRYMEFFATPYEDGMGSDLGDLVQEHQRLLEKGVDTLGGGGNKSVLIVYTTVLSITEQGTSYSSKKNVLYGNDLTGCDLRRFTQIEEFVNPPADYCVASAPSENDNYLNWIAGHMADAMGDDYVITGTIAFQGGIYCDPEELYINDQHNSVLENTSDFHPPIRLMVHPSSDVGTISWSSPTSSATLFTSGTGEFNTLNFQPAAFEQFNELVATWGGGQTSSISVLPVNFQVGVEEDLLVQQSNNIKPISFSYSNNGAPFPDRSDIIISLEGESNFTGAPDMTLNNPGLSGSILTWTPDEDGCNLNNLISELLPNDKGLLAITELTNFRMKCPFTIIDLEVKVPATRYGKVDPPTTPPTYRSAKHGEELFIVAADDSDLEDLKRMVEAKIIWEEEEGPETDDYWINDVDVSLDDEPIWRSSPSGSDIHLPNFAKTDTFALSHEGIFPAKINSLAPPAFGLLFSQPPEEFSVSVNAFEQDKKVDLVLTRKNEAVYSNTNLNSNVQKIIDKAAGISDKIKKWLGPNRPGQWPLSPVFKVTPKMTAWNEEDVDTRFYFNKTKTEVSIEIGMMLGDTTPPKKYMPLILPPPIGPTYRSFAGGKVEAGFGLAGKLTIKPSIELIAKKHNYQGVTDYVFQPPSVAGAVTSNIKFGAYAKAKANVGNVSIIAFGFSGELGPTITAELHYEWDEDTSDYEFYIDGTMSPLEGDIVATLSVFGFEVVDFSLMEWLELDGAIGPYTFDSRDFFAD